jgi:opacity protein-like surface antigen
MRLDIGGSMRRGVLRKVVLLGSACVAAGPAAAESGPYVGLFGGVARSGGQRIEQTGTAHRRDEWRLDGFRDFDLPVAVSGKADRSTHAAFGAHLGYEFVLPRSRVRPAVEIEYGRYATRPRANLANPVTETAAAIGQGGENAGLADPSAFVATHYAAGLHRFSDRMRFDLHTVMLNGVATLDTGTAVRPYIGAGVGVALGSARRAASFQTNPSGPIELTSDTHEEVNHFNSRPHDTDIAFAAQAKVGARFALTRKVSAFVEYRWVRVDAMRLDFGRTRYAGHPPTEDWIVRQGPSILQAGLVGLRLDL